MKNLFMFAICFSALIASAGEMMKMNYVNEELPKIIEDYSKSTGQKFIIDSTVRGKITILNQKPVSQDEAFNQISEALALNGFAFVTQNDVMVVRNARSAQRDNIPVVTELPPLRPQRMVTMIFSLKHISALAVQQQLRLLTSSYGEMSPVEKSNQIVISDWSGNLNRVAEVIKQVDQPADPKIEKIVAQAKKDKEAWKKSKAKVDGETKSPEPTTN
ncbi:MAG: general secretion pathway protein GspD [Bdellovibrionaceae bacterium]|nr:general secretion pathway protein GspD [Bdellovibrio sp.]